MTWLYYENISFSPILALSGSQLPEWANGGPILVFMVLKPSSLIFTQENRSNDMLHTFIMRHRILTRFGTTQWPSSGISIAQMG